MSDHNKMFESLEERKLFSGKINLGPNQIYFNAAKGDSMTYTLRVTNAGDDKLLLTSDALRIKGNDRYNFKVLDFPTTGISFRPGRQVNLTVQFDAFNGDASLAIKDAYLRIASNDPKKPVAKVPLRGLVLKSLNGGADEPPVQRLMEFFNLGITTGGSDSNYLFPSNPSTPNDEVSIQSFVKAGSGNVVIKPLAVFGNNSDPAIRMGYYTPGILDSEKYLWYVPGSSAQSVAPLIYGQTAFDPGSAAFGVATEYPNFTNADGTIRNVYQEDALNKSWDSNMARHMRFYAYKDAKGNVVPNAYIGIQEEYTTVYDFNDTVFIITNVAPAPSTPVLSYENPSGWPGNDVLVFNKVQTEDPDVGNIVRDSNTLRVRNSGLSDLVISTDVTGDYSISSGGGNGITIAPGASRDITVNFTATSGQTNHPGTLTITSNDPTNPTVAIALSGYWQVYSEFMSPTNRASSEPSAEMIVNKLFGYQTIIRPAGKSLHNNGLIQQIGDEILAQTFKIADSSGRVRVTEVATFHGVTYISQSTGETLPTNSYIGWYKKGSGGNNTIFSDEHVSGQMILPPKLIQNGTGNYTSPLAAGSFSPGSANQEFGFVVENLEYSEYDRNPYTIDSNGDGNPDSRPSNFGQFLRWFPLYDREGVLVPNTYIVLHDYNRGSITNYDFNDNIYVISNVIPVDAVKTPKTAHGFKLDDGRNRIVFTTPTDGPNITGFNVYRSIDSRGTYDLLTATPLARRAVTTWTDDSPASGVTYYYRITSVGDGGESQPLTVKI